MRLSIFSFDLRIRTESVIKIKKESERNMRAPSSSLTCEVSLCAVAPVVHIIMENGSEAPKAMRTAPEGAPSPRGRALCVITEEIIVSLLLSNTDREA